MNSKIPPNSLVDRWLKEARSLLKNEFYYIAEKSANWGYDRAYDSQRSKKNHLSDDQVLLALTSLDKNHSVMARELGISVSALRKLRLGDSYKNIHPEVPRWNEHKFEKTCNQCHNWSVVNSICNMGYPDPVEEGIGFAVECLMFTARDGPTADTNSKHQH